MDDPIDSAFQSRRFAHGKSKAKSGRGGGGGAAKPFNPLAALGRYEVSLGVGSSKYQHVLEIHELTESETGLLGTFDFAELTGMFVLAGSRKQLAEIISGFEESDDDDDPESDSEDSNESYEDGTGNSEDEPSALELQDEKVNRRARAFEKNSFRNPKFWMKWKGTPAADSDDETKPVQSDMGYLAFSNNACDKFDGTITCPALDWKQLKLKARKIHSKATPCPTAWNDVG